MNIHEYQAKEILKRYGVAVPGGQVAFSADEAEKIAREMGGDIFVVKAQIHAGGRGKGGGVKLAKSPKEVRELAAKMLGMQLVTHQTGPEGKTVHRVLIASGVDIERELYLGVVLDRSVSKLVIMASTEGGVEIEKVAEESPELIFKEYIEPQTGLQPFQARRLAFKLGLTGAQIKHGTKFIMSLYKAFVETDASLAEINPLVVTKSGEVAALDAKIEQLYHQTMDNRMTDGKRSGDSRSGRHLFGHLRQAGAHILAAGGSDWVVFAGENGYPADEKYFLQFIVETMRRALQNHPALDQQQFAQWIARRQAQIETGELVYIAHQLDFLGRWPG